MSNSLVKPLSHFQSIICNNLSLEKNYNQHCIISKAETKFERCFKHAIELFPINVV